LERFGLEPDVVSGASIGASLGVLRAQGRSTEHMLDALDAIGRKAFRWGLPGRSLLSSVGLRNGLKREFGTCQLEEVPVPCAVVASDLVSGRRVVAREGPVWKALLASMSIPGIYPPQREGRHLLVDGAVLNPVPVDAAADLGADKVVAVKLVGQERGRGKQTTGALPSFFNVILASLDLMQGRIGIDSAAAASVLIEPELGSMDGVSLRTFTAGRRFVEAGERAAEAALPRLAAAFPWIGW
jgi:NTE family protein